MVKVFNGTILLTFNGNKINDAIAITDEEIIPYNMPMAAMSCDLADGCSDYE
jgi:hypothetical protein